MAWISPILSTIAVTRVIGKKIYQEAQVMDHSVKVKKSLMICFMIIAMFTIFAPGLFASEEEKPATDVTVAVLSQYLWRGYELSRNGVVIQPSLTVGYKGFSVNIWGNLDAKPYYSGAAPDKSYSSAWNETDVTLAYSKAMGPFTVGGGYIYYGLGALNQDLADRLDSQEIFASLGLNTLLSPTLTVYKEIDHYHNWYMLLGISHVFELSKIMSLKLAASAGYLLSSDETTYPKFDGNALATTDKFNNFHDGSVTASMPLKVMKYVTVTPIVSYVFPLSRDARNEMKGFGLKGTATNAERDSSFLYGGVSASFSF